MELSGIKAQTNQEYVSLLSNPEFLKIVKTAKGDSRYSSLMSSLEKLNSLLEQSGEVSSKTDSSLKIVTNNNSPTNKLNDTVDEEMAKSIEELIRNAEELESMMNLEMVDNPDMVDLFEKFREIIGKLDKELRTIQEKSKSLKPKEKFLLAPDANSKSGFQQTLTFLVQ